MEWEETLVDWRAIFSLMASAGYEYVSEREMFWHPVLERGCTIEWAFDAGLDELQEFIVASDKAIRTKGVFSPEHLAELREEMTNP